MSSTICIPKHRIEELKDDQRNFYLFYAEKVTASSWTSRWQSRVFALTRFGTLEYYQNEQALKEGKVRYSIFLGDIQCAYLKTGKEHTVLELEFYTKTKSFKCRSRDSKGLSNLRELIMRLKAQVSKQDCLNIEPRRAEEFPRDPKMIRRGSVSVMPQNSMGIAIFVGARCVDILELGKRTKGRDADNNVLRDSRPILVFPESTVTVEVTGAVTASGSIQAAELDNLDVSPRWRRYKEFRLELLNEESKPVASAYLRHWNVGPSDFQQGAEASAASSPPSRVFKFPSPLSPIVERPSSSANSNTVEGVVVGVVEGTMMNVGGRPLAETLALVCLIVAIFFQSPSDNYFTRVLLAMALLAALYRPLFGMLASLQQLPKAATAVRVPHASSSRYPSTSPPRLSSSSSLSRAKSSPILKQRSRHLASVKEEPKVAGIVRLVEIRVSPHAEQKGRVSNDFAPDEKPLWATALAAASMQRLGFQKRIRALVFDYWHGEMREFTHYDSLAVLEGKEGLKLEEFHRQCTKLLEEKRGDSRLWLEHLVTHRHEECRFLMARDWDVQKAYVLVQKCIKLRKEFNLDTMLFKPPPKEEFRKFKTAVPVYHQGWNDRGQLLAVRLVGPIDTKVAMHELGGDKVRLFELAYNEIAQRILAPAISRVIGHREWRSHSIIDMQNAAVSNFLNSDLRKVFSLSTSVVQVCYPENLGEASVIRAPMMFSMIWSFIKGLLTKRTQSKITVDSKSDPGKVLAPKFVNNPCLPRELGGTVVNPGPLYINSELEQIVEAYMTGERDFTEILGDNSDYHLIA